MSTITYQQYENEPSFKCVKDVVNSLTELLVQIPKVADGVEKQEVADIVADISFESLEKTGVHTMKGTAYVSYFIENEDIYVRVSGKFDTESGELEESIVKVNMGIGERGIVVDFVVSPVGDVEVDNLIYQ